MRVQMHDRCTMQLSTKWLSLLFKQEKHCVQVPSQQRRKSHQRYVFFLMESPLNDGLNYTNKRFAFDTTHLDFCALQPCVHLFIFQIP